MRPTSARPTSARPSSTRPSSTRPGAEPLPHRPAPPPANPAGPQTADLDRLLDQDGTVPDGVAAQLNFFLGGGPECPDGELEQDEPPQVSTRQFTEIPSVPNFCFRGFDVARDVRIVVTTPTGSATMTLKARWQSLGGFAYPVPPGSPTGRYRVRATQGSRSADTEFQVRRASTPTMWIHRRNADLGETVDVYLGGFPPNKPADLHLYVCLPLRYRATTTVAIDRNGEGHLALHTTAATEPNCYAMNSPLIYTPPPVLPDSPDGPDNQVFWLHEPQPATPPNCLTRALRC
ncbi:hypothetical protein ACQPZX_27755 [Actinoplanes sp. CA-142083]|uniref:hypothetical protein n=1 Tax=Actinoplanes sp. CA-142083 TaxID=3239903 RepID=UPI003D93A743